MGCLNLLCALDRAEHSLDSAAAAVCSLLFCEGTLLRLAELLLGLSCKLAFTSGKQIVKTDRAHKEKTDGLGSLPSCLS